MIGTTLGSYRVTAKLGEGGMGVVYLAEHPLIGRKAAIKVLLPEMSRNPDLITRFFNEARTTALIKHPGLVDIFDFGLHPSGFAYLVMEFLEGETLAARLARDGRVPPPLAVSLAKQVTSAVGAAHGRGIVHRDLKPENIFLVPEKGAPFGLRAKILDFGIAKLGTSMASGNLRTTRTGSVLGTPLYMSPEQCKGAGKVDERSDIYSLGCILFEMVCGRTVFIVEGVGELIGAHMFMPPPSIRAIDGALPGRLDNIIQRLLAKDPAHRPQTMDEVDDDLSSLVVDLGWEFSDRAARAIAASRPDRPKRSLSTAKMIAEPPPANAPPGPVAAVPAGAPVRTTLGNSAGEISVPQQAAAAPRRRSSRLTLGLLAVGVATTVAAIAVVVATRGGPQPVAAPHVAAVPQAPPAAPHAVPAKTSPPAPVVVPMPPSPAPDKSVVQAGNPTTLPAPTATPPIPAVAFPASAPTMPTPAVTAPVPPPATPAPDPAKEVPAAAIPAPVPQATPVAPVETHPAKPAETSKPPGHPATPRKPQRPAASGKDDDDLLNSR